MWYNNNTRSPAILTIRVSDIGGQVETLKIGAPSAMKKHSLKIGIYDLEVRPGEALELLPGVVVELLFVRNAG